LAGVLGMDTPSVDEVEVAAEHPLYGAHLKVWWCRHELERMERESGTHRDAGPIRIRSEPHADGRGEEWFVVVRAPVPLEIGRIAADAVHNLRSALDHLAVALAVANGADLDATRASFPIASNYWEFHRHAPPCSPSTGHVAPSGKHAIRDLSELAQTFVEGKQMHERWDKSAHLFELRYLDNRDKHRILNPAYIQPTAYFNMVGLEIEWDHHPPGSALVDGTHLASVRFAPDNPGMKMQTPLVAAISVGRSTGGFIPLDELGLYASTVREIIDEAQAAFFP